mgnify:CR=1 FL=1
MATVFVIKEDGHGVIGVATTRRAGMQFLIDQQWVDGYSEIWNPATDECDRLKDLYGEGWKEINVNVVNRDWDINYDKTKPCKRSWPRCADC